MGDGRRSDPRWVVGAREMGYVRTGPTVDDDNERDEASVLMVHEEVSW
jgi:hypothetical protein